MSKGAVNPNIKTPEASTLDRAALLGHWRDVFGRPPPKHISVSFMQRAIFFEQQSRSERRLSKQTLRRLKTIAKGGAPQLEKAIALAVREHFAAHDLLPRLVEELDAKEVDQLKGKIGSLTQKFACPNAVLNWSEFVGKVDIGPGKLSVELNAASIAKHLELPAKRLSVDALTISAAFRLRRKGVETKIVLGNASPEIDLILISNIVKAMDWFEEIKSGQTFTQIAARARTSKRRVQDVIDLAFLAPDIIDQAVNGTLPLHFTSDYLIKTGVPVDWTMQRKMLEEPGFINV